MKKTAITLLLPVALADVLSAADATFVLAERGKAADCAIVVPADAPEPVRYAAEELRDFTAKTTGVALPIVSSTTGKAVVLETMGPGSWVLGPESWVLSPRV